MMCMRLPHMEGAIEVLTHSVRLWGLGTGPQVHDVAVYKQGIERPLEYAAAIGDDRFDREQGQPGPRILSRSRKPS